MRFSFSTVGLMAAVAVAFIVFTSPSRQPVADDYLQQPTSAYLDSSALAAQVEDNTARIGVLESKLDGLYASIDELKASPAPTPAPQVPKATQSVVEVRTPVRTAAKAAATVAAKAVKGAAIVATAPVRAVANYQPRWRNNDGRSLKQHTLEVHGFDPSLSDAELYAMHDAWHDANGGDPPTRSRSVYKSVSSGDCPGGVCPVPSRTVVRQSRGGLLGFGVLGRRR